MSPGTNVVVALARRRERARGGGNYESADRVRAEIRAVDGSRATVRGARS
jgi:cysteinyl-tRNA synthetase